MGLRDYLLYRLAKNWPSPMAKYTERFQAEPGSEAYHMAYAQHQYDWKVSYGLMRAVKDLEVLEIGTGHGGISCFMAAVGARRVVGIDVNTNSLEYARRFVRQASSHYGADYRLPVELLVMSADRLSFRDDQFDMVLADNVFEHFTDPEAVMREAYRVLKPGGGVLIPVFSSIKSKYGLHLKHGIKMPWANIFFSERTIIRAMYRMAAANPNLYEVYPGMAGDPKRVRDLRRHGDLNDITYRSFKEMAARVGFQVESFRAFGTRLGKIVSRLPLLGESVFTDILSTGATAYLLKPNRTDQPNKTNHKP